VGGNLALGLDETKWREIFKLPFIVTQNTHLDEIVVGREGQQLLQKWFDQAVITIWNSLYV
jgi:hypothetical protein